MQKTNQNTIESSISVPMGSLCCVWIVVDKLPDVITSLLLSIVMGTFHLKDYYLCSGNECIVISFSCCSTNIRYSQGFQIICNNTRVSASDFVALWEELGSSL